MIKLCFRIPKKELTLGKRQPPFHFIFPSSPFTEFRSIKKKPNEAEINDVLYYLKCYPLAGKDSYVITTKALAFFHI